MLQITLVIEDSISLDDLQEEIAEIEDHVQSTDVAGMFYDTFVSCGSADGDSHAETLDNDLHAICVILLRSEPIIIAQLPKKIHLWIDHGLIYLVDHMSNRIACLSLIHVSVASIFSFAYMFSCCTVVI